MSGESGGGGGEAAESSSSGSSGSGSRTIVTNLASIIRSLEEASENDNRKIALLLILCELMRTGKLSSDLGRENEERLFKSIGAHFLARLLVTRQEAPGANCSKHIYKSVCLSILTQFCAHAKLVQDPLILTRITAFFDILKLPIDGPATTTRRRDDEQSGAAAASDDCSGDADERKLLVNLKLDTFKFLFAVAKYDPEYLCNNGLFDVLFGAVILNEREAPEYKLMGENFDETTTKETDFGLLSCKLIRAVLESFEARIVEKSSKNLATAAADAASPPSWSKPHRFAENFSAFLSRIDATKSKFKFQLVNYLNCLLASPAVTAQITANDDLNETSARELYSIVSELLRSKQQVQLAFFLLKHFVDLFQFEYIYMKDRKFFYFVIHVMCIQTALNLEAAASSGASTTTTVDLALMTIYYQLLEDVIVILSTASPFDAGEDDDDDDEEDDDTDEEEDDFEDDDDDYLPGKKVNNRGSSSKTSPKAKNQQEQQQQQQAKNEPELESVIKIVVELLESVMLYVRDELKDDDDEDRLRKLDANTVVLVASSIRLLMCWLSHESLLEKEILDLMPRFIKFAEFMAHQELSTTASLTRLDLYGFLSAGVQKTYLNLKAKLDLKKSKSSHQKLANDAKSEFEIFELSQEMDKMKAILDKCYEQQSQYNPDSGDNAAKT